MAVLMYILPNAMKEAWCTEASALADHIGAEQSTLVFATTDHSGVFGRWSV